VSTNGHRVFTVRRSQAFQDKLDQRSAYQASLERILQGVEWSLGRDPRFNARHVVADVWVIETPRDIEAPVIWVYYTINGDVVTLQHYEIVQAWEV
jgi:hypothetical protein